MMYSGKPPPLKAFANGGTPTKEAAALIGMAGLMPQQQQQPEKSENCDPNYQKLSIFGKEALRKARESSSPVLDDSNGRLTMQKPQSDGLEALVSAAALSECDNNAKEVNRVPAAKTSSSSLPSPTKASPPIAHQHSHGHSHGGRAPHFCRSPRCASNNPDYATPIQPSPRKYLVSKRHLLPGAICTKDPAILASQITQQQESSSAASTTPQAAYSTGKPPKPSGKIENGIRQPSFANVVAAERTTPRTPPPFAYETSPTRIPKPPSSARSPAAAAAGRPSAGLHESVASCCLPPDLAFSGVSGPSASATGTSFSEFSPHNGEALQRPDLSKSLEEDGILQETIAELHVDGGLVRSRRVGSDTSCSVAVAASTSPRNSFDAGGSSSDAEVVASVSPTLLDSRVTYEGNGLVQELSTLPEERRISSLTSMELPVEELSSDQRTPEPDGSVFDSTSMKMPSAELEDVTEKLAEKLAFENVEETSHPQGGDCNYTEEMASADGLNGRRDSEDGSIICHEEEGAEEQQFSYSETGLQFAEGNRFGADCQAEENAEAGDYRYGGNTQAGDYHHETNEEEGDYHHETNEEEGDYQYGKNAGRETHQFQNQMPEFDISPSSEGTEEGTQEGQEEVRRGRSISSYIEEFESAQQSKQTEGQREVPKYVRGKGRQLWRSDCRDSREVVFLKQTPQADRRGEEDWMVDSILEGAISKLNPSGQGRVRVLVEAFESLLNLGGNPEMVDRRASRVWCLNRMEKGEVDEDGEEFEEGDQRVDCYEVSGDGLQLRASMRLSLGGGNRLPLCDQDEVDEIEMSAIQKVQEWDDDCRQSSQSFQDVDSNGSFGSQSQADGGVAQDQEIQNEGHFQGSEMIFGDLQDEGHYERSGLTFGDLQNDGHFEGSGLTFEDFQRRNSFLESHSLQNDNDRSSEDFSCDARTESQFGCFNRGDVNQGIDTRSTFSLEQGYKPKGTRRRRYWKSNPVNLEAAGPSPNGDQGKDQRVIRGTSLEPFHLLTEERGVMKEYQFAKKLEEMFAEEERLRNPIAQGLPWTTDEPEIVPKPPVKDQTRPVEFRHYSDSRAIERAEFDNYMAERALYMEMQKQEAERLRQLAEQEEIKRLRREMVPRAQLMPFFNQPFIPTRSSKRLTVPKEPTFLNRQHKRAKCIVWQQQQQQQNQQQPWTYE
ncbi:unnamed protein product [Calypogeia fissa]